MASRSTPSQGSGKQLRETHTALASDGWPLALYRYAPRGDAPRGEPVLLLHGLGTCAKQFDLPVGPSAPPTPSLSRWLSARGYDVWACDLRGVGGSRHPGSSRRGRWTWTVDDHLHRDVPAFLRYILQRSDHDRLHWVGHSMGGILLLCHCALFGSDRVASGVAAAAAIDYSGIDSRYDLIVPLKELGLLVRRVPSGTAIRWLAPLFGRVKTPLEAALYNPANMQPEAMRALVGRAHYDISGAALHQLATLFAPGGLRALEDNAPYAAQAHRISTPILFLSGERDLQCAPAVVERAHASLGGSGHEVARFGKRHGQVEDYGHFDLLSGRRADREVFPHVLAWLEAHPATARR